MKVLITVAVWKRPEIFHIMTAGLQRMRTVMDDLGVDSQVLFILDQTDQENCEHVYDMQRCDHNLLHTVISNDMPLGERMNRAMLDANGLDWDYMMQMGSDDIITDAGVLSLMAYAWSGCPFFGFRQLYLVDSKTKMMKQLLTPNTFGAGRMISRSLVDKTHTLWDANQRSGLDGRMQENVYGATNQMPYIVNCYRPSVFDIKSDLNINNYTKLFKKEVPLNTNLCPELKYVAEL